MMTIVHREWKQEQGDQARRRGGLYCETPPRGKYENDMIHADNYVEMR